MSHINGCPCNKTCCDNPDPGSLSEMSHECLDSKDCYEDEHYMTECGNCGKRCNCEV